ncbi:unnamed protein product [Arabis nemorensis]|uniref:Uncharacterized protein n=1 Tax=Arabis nemorensis TaxID=586526 RepID=A0A565AUB2_9BRAS|nr:unnamed protein product [Arabis nemorensis]
MFSLHDQTFSSKKRDQNGESFHGSFKRSKQAKLENNPTLFYQRSKSESTMLIKPDVQLHLDAKTQSETFEDHRTHLDLELNLSSSSSSNVKTIMKKDECSKGKTLIMTPSKKEISVCMKCHMLVMLCKSTLVCPNCKFMHPDDHCSTKQFKPLSLFKLLY